MDVLDRMILWEQGELAEDETIQLFQELTDSGVVWQLQGNYGRTAMALISTGLISTKDDATMRSEISVPLFEVVADSNPS